MNCRDFIIEFEERGTELSGAAQIHIRDCDGCRKITVAQTRIWETIDEFPKIDAPQNFDFRVRARISSARPSDFQSPLLPVLRYVLPFAVIVLVVGLLAFNTSLFWSNENTPQTAQVNPVAPPVRETIPTNAETSVPSVAGNNIAQSFTEETVSVNTANARVKPSNETREVEYVAANSIIKSPAAPRRETSVSDSDAGSRDSTYAVPQVKTLPGFKPLNTPEILSNGVASKPVVNEEIWSVLGIEVISENGARIVKAIKPASPAARMGLKLGDAIEEIDGVKLSVKPLGSANIEVRSLTVRRGNQTLEMSLKN